MSVDVARLTSGATAAADDRPAEATLLAWAALVTDAAAGIRTVVVEQSGRPPSDFFAVLEQAMPGPMPTPQPGESAEAWLLRCRDGLLSLLPATVAEELSGKLLDRIDLHGIEAPTAYLVESAAATGDSLLVSVIARWALISGAISEMAALPADFASAVAAVRTAILGALNDADAQRLRTQLAPI
ncbi:MAG: hypothetical protein VW362_10595 [Candidatus Nanopelagicales bacterium]